MIFTLDGRLRLTDCPAALRRALMEELTIPNPAYTRAAYLGLPTYSIRGNCCCMRCRAMS